jgi:hypothetical protein
MNTELRSHEHRTRRLTLWIAFYTLVFILFITGLFTAANQIHTHTLPVGQIELIIPHSQYVVGEPITFQIINKLNAPIYVINKCPAEPLAVYYKQSGVWQRVHADINSNKCLNENRQEPIAANSTREGSFKDWASMFAKPGQYRVVAIVEHYNALPYQDFEVIVPPTPAPKPVAAPVPVPVVNQASKSTSQSTQSTSTPTSPNQTLKSKTITLSSGSISVQYNSTQIYVISVTPQSGCTYEGGRSGTQVQVTFKCGGNETQLQLSIVNGQLQQRVENGG